MSNSMSDHAKPVARFVQDCQERKAELEASIKKTKAELQKLEMEMTLMTAIVDNGQGFLNLTNAKAGGESAIVLPENMRR